MAPVDEEPSVELSRRAMRVAKLVPSTGEGRGGPALDDGPAPADDVPAPGLFLLTSRGDMRNCLGNCIMANSLERQWSAGLASALAAFDDEPTDVETGDGGGERHQVRGIHLWMTSLTFSTVRLRAPECPHVRASRQRSLSRTRSSATGLIREHGAACAGHCGGAVSKQGIRRARPREDVQHAKAAQERLLVIARMTVFIEGNEAGQDVLVVGEAHSCVVLH